MNFIHFSWFEWVTDPSKVDNPIVVLSTTNSNESLVITKIILIKYLLMIEIDKILNQL